MNGGTMFRVPNTAATAPLPPYYVGTTSETVVYPRCQLADGMGPGAHDFTDARDTDEHPVIYCRACGLVQRLEVLP